MFYGCKGNSIITIPQYLKVGFLQIPKNDYFVSHAVFMRNIDGVSGSIKKAAGTAISGSLCL